MDSPDPTTAGGASGDDRAESSNDLTAEARIRMLRLVTRSFCREIVGYGVDVRDLLKVSSQIVDFAANQTERPNPAAEGAFGRFALTDIAVDGPSYRMGACSIRPFGPEDLAPASTWVAREDIRTSMLVPYPEEVPSLRAYFASADRAYHVIQLDDVPAGLIGAEGIDPASRRVEMRKFIGEPSMRGRGLGTAATFLWLHHIFDVLEFNKVYIHTHHANARNLRVNRSLGFAVEGVLAQEHLLDGAYVDIVRMGLLRADWRSRAQRAESS